LFEENIGIPLVEAKCEFKTPAYFEDVLLIETSAADVRDKVIRLNHDIYRNDTLLATGYEVRVCVSINQGKIKAAPLPEKVREALTKP
jgi:acyl-CoA thioester hydrolase